MGRADVDAAAERVCGTDVCTEFQLEVEHGLGAESHGVARTFALAMRPFDSARPSAARCGL